MVFAHHYHEVSGRSCAIGRMTAERKRLVCRFAWRLRPESAWALIETGLRAPLTVELIQSAWYKSYRKAMAALDESVKKQRVVHYYQIMNSDKKTISQINCYLPFSPNGY